MKAKSAAIALLCAFAGCKGGESAPVSRSDDPCAFRIIGPLATCEISPMHLLSIGASLEGRDITVVLYYPGYGADVMFASHEAAETHDLPSAFVVDWPELDPKLLDEGGLLRPGYYRVSAKFRRIPPLTVGEGVVVPLVVAGRLSKVSELKKVKIVAEIRDNCAKTPSCTMNYLHGMFPIPKLGPH